MSTLSYVSNEDRKTNQLNQNTKKQRNLLIELFLSCVYLDGRCSVDWTTIHSNLHDSCCRRKPLQF
jgi:hypothetical protein